MALARYEDGVSIFTVGGMLGEEPPETTAGIATRAGPGSEDLK